jgi:hypothetical protein
MRADQIKPDQEIQHQAGHGWCRPTRIEPEGEDLLFYCKGGENGTPYRHRPDDEVVVRK